MYLRKLTRFVNERYTWYVVLIAIIVESLVNCKPLVSGQCFIGKYIEELQLNSKQNRQENHGACDKACNKNPKCKMYQIASDSCLMFESKSTGFWGKREFCLKWSSYICKGRWSQNYTCCIVEQIRYVVIFHLKYFYLTQILNFELDILKISLHCDDNNIARIYFFGYIAP